MHDDAEFIKATVRKAKLEQPVSRDDCEQALELLAKQCRKKSETFEQTYARIIDEEPKGRVLYKALDAVTDTGVLDTPHWQAIEALADKMRETVGRKRWTREQAINFILTTPAGKALNEKHEAEVARRVTII